MNEYDFKTLNDREFEKLARDLIQRDTGLVFESFKPGKDGGIDLQNTSLDEGKKIIVQVKHWPRMSFSSLLSELKKRELPKIKKLKPEKYILVTSLELNPQQKEEIVDNLKPFIKTTGDILGKDDLNGRLIAHKDIEIDHPKLWLSSSNVMQRILKNAVNGRSDFEENKIKKEISLYVATEKYADALKILNKERFLLILGEPGVGKTTLSKMLIHQHLGRGYKLVKINERISEGEDAWVDGKKQIFYFNDFLGANISEILQQRNSDSSLLDFINRIKADKNKRLILNSRTAILSKAKTLYVKYKDPIIDLAKHEVYINDYSKLDKARILYNHLYFLKSDKRFIDQIKNNRFYKAIINHRNYNPRLIEFITDPLRTSTLKPTEYVGFINDKLDNPADVYLDTYDNQTDDYEKFLLHTLFSLDDRVSEAKLMETFENRIKYEVDKNGFRNEPDLFRKTIKKLEGGFVVTERNGDGELFYRFLNPSITDFFIHYLSNSPDVKWRIFESSVYTSQLIKRFAFSSRKSFFKKRKDQDRLLSLLKIKASELKNDYGGCQYIDLLDFAYSAFDPELVDEICPLLIECIDFNLAKSHQASGLLRSIEYMFGYEESEVIIRKRWKEIIDFTFSGINTKEEFEAVLNLFNLYGVEYRDYLSDPYSKKLVYESLSGYWLNTCGDFEFDYHGFDEEELSEFIEDEVRNGENFNKKFGFSEIPALYQLRDIDTDYVIERNQENARDEYMSDIHKEQYHEARSSEKEMDRAIDELFR